MNLESRGQGNLRCPPTVVGNRKKKVLRGKKSDGSDYRRLKGCVAGGINQGKAGRNVT